MPFRLALAVPLLIAICRPSHAAAEPAPLPDRWLLRLLRQALERLNGAHQSGTEDPHERHEHPDDSGFQDAVEDLHGTVSGRGIDPELLLRGRRQTLHRGTRRTAAPPRRPSDRGGRGDVQGQPMRSRMTATAPTRRRRKPTASMVSIRFRQFPHSALPKNECRCSGQKDAPQRPDSPAAGLSY